MSVLLPTDDQKQIVRAALDQLAEAGAAVDLLKRSDYLAGTAAGMWHYTDSFDEDIQDALSNLHDHIRLVIIQVAQSATRARVLDDCEKNHEVVD